MAGKRELIRKINSLRNTEKLTSAMRMIAYTKLQKLQAIYRDASAFGEALNNINAKLGIFDFKENSLENYVLPKNFKGHLHMTVFTADRGLCGAFNSNIQKIVSVLTENFPENAMYSITMFGSKGIKYCENHSIRYTDGITPLPKLPKIETIKDEAYNIIRGMKTGKYQEVFLVYTRFVSTLEQVPVIVSLMPDKYRNKDDIFFVQDENRRFGEMNMEFEPDAEEVVVAFIEQVVLYKLFAALVDSMTAENAARMTAMENAAANCRNLTDHYRIIFNRSRQADITTELLEIIAGTEAMKH